MADEQRMPRYRAPKGKEMRLNLLQEVNGYRAVHHSGSGPGLLLLSSGAALDDGMKARAELFAEEGYSVLAIPGMRLDEEVIEAAKILCDMPETGDGLVAIGYGVSGLVLCETALDTGIQALVLFDCQTVLDRPSRLDQVPCPLVCHFGAADRPGLSEQAAQIQAGLKRKDGSRIFAWEEGREGFADPGHENFDIRADDLAHTRTLELIRRVVGPYFDFVSLFAEHVHHEFTTRDVDATMYTMIEEPYVNHVPTLAGGVGHDMLKRFYKYHFVDQNAGGRDRTRISYTPGPNRVVLETYTKFRHDSVIDRYFPGIEPTGKVVEIATVIIVKFRGDKVCHEHLYWDQGSALKQIGVLDAGDLPLAGAEAARKVLDENLPSNIFMQEAWKTSEGKEL